MTSPHIPDGSIWFTDPGYGISLDYEGNIAEYELPTNVYRLDPNTGNATVVADDFVRPNGLCFSPDEKILYITDTGSSHGLGGPAHIRAFDVAKWPPQKQSHLRRHGTRICRWHSLRHGRQPVEQLGLGRSRR